MFDETQASTEPSYIDTKTRQFTNVIINVVDNWARNSKINSKGANQTPNQTPRTETLSSVPPNTNTNTESGNELKSFNMYLTSEDKVQSVNEYSDSIPDKVEGSYRYDFNILDIHKLIVKKFNHKKEHDVAKLEQILKLEEQKINGRQNMIERKASLQTIEKVRHDLRDILSDQSFNDYILKVSPLINAYSLLGTLSTIVSFAKNKKEVDEESPEDAPSQAKRHQLILDFIEIGRKYIQIDLVREIKDGENDCPVCGGKLDEVMSSLDEDGISMCTSCNTERISVVRTRFFQDNARTNNTSNNYEDRANFKKVLMRKQGKQPDKPPAELYQKLEQYFIDKQVPRIDLGNGPQFVSSHHIRTVLPLNEEGEKTGTSRALMYKALKEIDHSDFYDDIDVICNVMWGWDLMDFTYLEDQLMDDYDISQRIYEILPKDRKSSLNSQFRAYKQLRRRGFPCRTNQFRIPTTHDILEFHNTMWAKMCEALEWENL